MKEQYISPEERLLIYLEREINKLDKLIREDPTAADEQYETWCIIRDTHKQTKAKYEQYQKEGRVRVPASFTQEIQL